VFEKASVYEVGKSSDRLPLLMTNAIPRYTAMPPSVMMTGARAADDGRAIQRPHAAPIVQAHQEARRQGCAQGGTGLPSLAGHRRRNTAAKAYTDPIDRSIPP